MIALLYGILQIMTRRQGISKWPSIHCYGSESRRRADSASCIDITIPLFS